MANWPDKGRAALHQGEAVAVGGDEAEPVVQLRFRLSPFLSWRFLQGRLRLGEFLFRAAPGKAHPLPINAGEVVLEVVGGHGKNGLFDHLLDHAALHLDQLLVGDLRDRGELVRRQAMELVPGIPHLDLQVGIVRAGEVQGLSGQLLDQIKEVVGLDREGPVLLHFRRVKTPEAHLQVGGGNDYPVFIGLQEKIGQYGHGAPAVHHS